MAELFLPRLVIMRGHREVPKNPPLATHPSRLLPYKHPIGVSILESTHLQVLILNNLKSFRFNTYKKAIGGPCRLLGLPALRLLQREHAGRRICVQRDTLPIWRVLQFELMLLPVHPTSHQSTVTSHQP